MDENKITEPVVEVENEYSKLLNDYTTYQKNSVSLDKYSELEAKNEMLRKALFEGKSIESASTDAASEPSSDDLRNFLYGKNGKNVKNSLQYAEASLKLREKNLLETGIDDYIPIGRKYSPTIDDKMTAERVAEGLQHCVDIANGDNDVFVSEFIRITKDTGLNNLYNRR